MSAFLSVVAFFMALSISQLMGLWETWKRRVRFHDYRNIKGPREAIPKDLAVSEVEAAYDQAITLKQAAEDRTEREVEESYEQSLVINEEHNITKVPEPEVETVTKQQKKRCRQNQKKAVKLAANLATAENL